MYSPVGPYRRLGALEFNTQAADRKKATAIAVSESPQVDTTMSDANEALVPVEQTSLVPVDSADVEMVWAFSHLSLFFFFFFFLRWPYVCISFLAERLIDVARTDCDGIYD